VNTKQSKGPIFRAEGLYVRDAQGDVLAKCISEKMADQIVAALVRVTREDRCDTRRRRIGSDDE